MAKKKTSSNKKQVIKGRYWSFFIYPDSAPSNWNQILTQSNLPVAVSPLHDKDVDELEGTSKKPHYHVIVVFKGPTTENNVIKNFTSKLNCPDPRVVLSVPGAYRYFWHMDNPDKFQYPDGGQLCLNGFSIYDFKEFSNSEKNNMFDTIEEIIFEHKFTELVHLVRHLKRVGLYDELYMVRRNTVYVNALIRSNKFDYESQLKELEEFINRKAQLFQQHGVLEDETINKITDLFGHVKIVE